MRPQPPARNAIAMSVCLLCRISLVSNCRQLSILLPSLAPAVSTTIASLRTASTTAAEESKGLPKQNFKLFRRYRRHVWLKDIGDQQGEAQDEGIPLSGKLPKYHGFTATEIDIARQSIELHRRNLSALQILTAPPGEARLPRDLNPLVTPAVAALNVQIRIISDHVEMRRHMDHTMREARKFTRRLLVRGWSEEAMKGELDKISATDVSVFVLQVLSTTLSNGLVRLSSQILRVCGQDDRIKVSWLTRLYHMLVRLTIEKTPLHLMKERTVELYKILLVLIRPDGPMVDKQTVVGRNLPLPQETFRLLIASLPAEYMDELALLLPRTGLPVTPHTYFHIIRRLCEPIRASDGSLNAPYWRRAWDVLNMIINSSNPDVRSPAARRACFSVLYRAIINSDQAVVQAILKLLKKARIDNEQEDRLLIYNMLLTRAAAQRDMAGMSSVFDSMLEAGVKPGPSTYAIMHLPFKKTGDHAGVQAMRAAVVKVGGPNMLMMTDILHSRYLEGCTFHELVGYFARFFELKALRELHLIPHDVWFPPLTNALCVDNVVLGIMVASWAGANGIGVRSLSELWEFYRLYRGILYGCNTPNKVIFVHAGPFVPQALMMAFGHHRDGIDHTATILRDMMQPRSPIQPTIYMWGILLLQLVRARRMSAAEAVMEGMQPQFKPNAVCWSTLLWGYLRDPGQEWEAGIVLKRMMGQNVEPTEVTLHIIAFAADNETFMAAAGLKDAFMTNPVKENERKQTKEDIESKFDKMWQAGLGLSLPVEQEKKVEAEFEAEAEVKLKARVKTKATKEASQVEAQRFIKGKKEGEVGTSQRIDEPPALVRVESIAVCTPHTSEAIPHQSELPVFSLPEPIASSNQTCLPTRQDIALHQIMPSPKITSPLIKPLLSNFLPPRLSPTNSRTLQMTKATTASHNTAAVVQNARIIERLEATEKALSSLVSPRLLTRAPLPYPTPQTELSTARSLKSTNTAQNNTKSNLGMQRAQEASELRKRSDELLVQAYNLRKRSEWLGRY